MLLEGKRLVITGVLDPRSIAFHVARIAQEQGAEVVLTGFGRARRLTERTAKRLPEAVDVYELDVTKAEDVEQLRADLEERWGAVDGLLHAVAYAPESCLGDGFTEAPWEDVATAMQISTWSLPAIAGGLAPLLAKGSGSVVALDFDATVAWPNYNWMGVAKAGLESAARYLARDLGPQGVRVNLVAAGPLRTMAATHIEGFEGFEAVWGERAPLGWDVTDPEPVARSVCALFSDWLPATTGEIVHVDGGTHAMGA